MTRERIAGFMLGISVGTAIGFFLRHSNGTDENGNRQISFDGMQNRAEDVQKTLDPQDRRWPVSPSMVGK